MQGARKIRSTVAARRSLPKRSKTCCQSHPAVIPAALVSMEDELMGEKAVLIWW